MRLQEESNVSVGGVAVWRYGGMTVQDCGGVVVRIVADGGTKLWRYGGIAVWQYERELADCGCFWET